ncbi:hypothetical protein FG386_002083 [Cryptosporidium ryanae]|uniref:uncharacterized protein n=1 Tax=Cryptosporidium ryanae TaxID=515981 RepID=UPI00351A00CB|nr:hypothetical protein FG386_002083 [Cryptosporidium ryanae]
MIKEESLKESETGMVIDGLEGDLSTVGSAKEQDSFCDNGKGKGYNMNEDIKVEVDNELVCIDFFLRYLSYLFPLWAEYGDNFMFHITQIYGAFSKSEYHPYIQILESLGLEIGKEGQDGASNLNQGFMIGDSLSYPLDIEKCDTQTCIKAISYLDSYREWIDNILARSGYDFEGHLQLSTEMAEGTIGRSVHEWKLEEITGEIILPLVYQSYVTFDFRIGDRGDIDSLVNIGESSGNLDKALGIGCDMNKMGAGVGGVRGGGFGSSPSKNGNEVGVTYEKNRDRWVAVWTENGIRRSRIFNVKQYGYDTAREMAIQYRREQIMNLSNKSSSQTVQNQAQRCSKRSRKSIETSSKALKSPSFYNTRNSGGLEVVSVKNPDFEVYFDVDRDSWICKNTSGTLNLEEGETVFSVEEHGSEKARQLAIDKAGGLSEEPVTQTPVKKGGLSRSSVLRGSANTPKKRDSTACGSSSFRIKIANGSLGGSKGLDATGTGVDQQNQQQTSGGRGESRRSSMDEFLVYHGKKYYFGPVIEGIRYDKIQNRWVTGYIGQDGRKRYKYFSIGAYGFEGSRQLAIEYREGLYSSTKGVDKLSEFLQTVIQGFPALEDGTLQDVSFEDLIFQKGQIKGGSEKFYLCVPSKGDFLVTTPVEENDELYISLVNKYKYILENNAGKESGCVKDSVGVETPDKQSNCTNTAARAHLEKQEAFPPVKPQSKIDLGRAMDFPDSFNGVQDGVERRKDAKRENTTSSEFENINTENNSSIIEESEKPSYALNGVQIDQDLGKKDVYFSQESVSSSASNEKPGNFSSADTYEDSMFIEVEDRTVTERRKRLFIGPKVDGVHYNPSIHRWVAQYEQDGVQLTKNFSAKTYGFEKSRHLAIEWRTKHHGEPPQMNVLLQALKEQGIEYPPKQ